MICALATSACASDSTKAEDSENLTHKDDGSGSDDSNNTSDTGDKKNAQDSAIELYESNICSTQATSDGNDATNAASDTDSKDSTDSTDPAASSSDEASDNSHDSTQPLDTLASSDCDDVPTTGHVLSIKVKGACYATTKSSEKAACLLYGALRDMDKLPTARFSFQGCDPDQPIAAVISTMTDCSALPDEDLHGKSLSRFVSEQGKVPVCKQIDGATSWKSACEAFQKGYKSAGSQKSGDAPASGNKKK